MENFPALESNPETLIDLNSFQICTFKVVGMMVTAEFQKSKFIVEALHRCYPEVYGVPEVKGMLNVDWSEFLKNERRSRGGQFWGLKKPVAIYLNEEFLGDNEALSSFVSARYVLPFTRDFHKEGREALKDHISKLMDDGRSCIYLSAYVDCEVIGSMLFMLYDDMVPKTCRLFVKRCKKLKGGYSGTPIHRIVKECWIQCGGHTLTPVKMPCENFSVSHDKRGILSMCNSGRHKDNTTQFLITLEKTPWMDTHYVAFGQLLHGEEVLQKIEEVPTKYQAPQLKVGICKAGEFNLSVPRPLDDKTEAIMWDFLDYRKEETYKEYAGTAIEELFDQAESREGLARVFWPLDMQSYKPFSHLPDRIKQSFNYVAGKKDSCTFELLDCTRCGCSHDVNQRCAIGENLTQLRLKRSES